MALAKADKTRQLSAFKPLSVEMRNAIDLLGLGQSDAQVAEQVGVTRQTICQWRHDNPQFLSGLNRSRQGVWQAAHDRFRALLQKAIDKIEAALDGEEGLNTARDLLNRCGLATIPAPMGETDPEAYLISGGRWSRRVTSSIFWSNLGATGLPRRSSSESSVRA